MSSLETVAWATTVALVRTVFFRDDAFPSSACRVGLPAPGKPSVPEGITGTTITGDPVCPVAIAGISTGSVETVTTTPAGAGGGGGVAGSLGGGGAGDGAGTCT
jgi:hypothetical protein